MDKLIPRMAMRNPEKIGVFAFLGLLICACSTPPSDPTRGSIQRGVIETVLENIHKRYATALPISEISIAGLKGLSGTDDLLLIKEEKDIIMLFYKDRVLQRWQKPQTNDYKLWAHLTSDALTLAQAESHKVRDTNEEHILKRFFEAGFENLDRYTRYHGPDQTRNTRARREGFGGLGITIHQKQGETFVSEIYEGTPAFKQGLMAGDRITHVGGELLTGLPQKAVIRKLRGPVHSRAKLTIIRGTRLPPLEVTMIRAHIIIPTVKSTLEGRILNIKVSGFNQGTSRSLGKVLSGSERNTETIKGIILDLRGNPGGLLEQAIAIADYFLNDGRIISTEGRTKHANQIFDASLGDRAHGVPIVILVNGLSASASEIVAAALRDRGRAVIVGSSSYGKGSVQTIIRLPNQGELTLTWAHMIAPSGLKLEGYGVIPKVCTSGQKPHRGTMMSASRNGVNHNDYMPKFLLGSLYAVSTYPAMARKYCPPSNLERLEDIEIARYLLNHKKIYFQALNNGASAIAER
tara:strand:+ start:11381 stop:12943 length:1563 start_codon:yes stop_codon:yes gene_type:complete